MKVIINITSKTITCIMITIIINVEIIVII